jgi:hypothetical protein
MPLPPPSPQPMAMGCRLVSSAVKIPWLVAQDAVDLGHEGDLSRRVHRGRIGPGGRIEGSAAGNGLPGPGKGEHVAPVRAGSRGERCVRCRGSGHDDIVADPDLEARIEVRSPVTDCLRFIQRGGSAGGNIGKRQDENGKTEKPGHHVSLLFCCSGKKSRPASADAFRVPSFCSGMPDSLGIDPENPSVQSPFIYFKSNTHFSEPPEALCIEIFLFNEFAT